MRPGWEHKAGALEHVADAHYSGDGKWVCFTCRAPVEFTGATETGTPEPPRDAPPGGLESDGS